MQESADRYSTRHALALGDAIMRVCEEIDGLEVTCERLTTIRPTAVLNGPIEAVLMWIRGPQYEELVERLDAHDWSLPSRRSMGGRGAVYTHGVVEVHLWPINEAHFRSHTGATARSE